MNRSGVVLTWALVLIASAIWVVVASAASAQQGVKVGFITQMSGRNASFGAVAKQGALTALNEIEQVGGINGRKVSIVFEDSKGDQAAAQKAFTKLVTEDGADVIVGHVSDEIAPELARLADQNKIPLIMIGPQATAITVKDCNRFTFRLTPNGVHNSKTAALIAGWTKAKSWIAITADNPGNRELWTLFKKYLLQLRKDTSFDPDSAVTLVGGKAADLDASVKKIAESGAEGVLVSLDNSDFLEFVRKGNAARLFDGKREFIVVMGSLAVLLALGTEMPEGIWWSTPYWYQASWSPANRSFAQKYEAAYGAPPSWEAQFSYAAIKIYAAAAQKAKSKEKKEVVQALEGLSDELPVGKITVRAEDHQGVMHTMGGKTARIGVTARKSRFRSLATMMLFRVSEISDPETEKSCAMK